MGRRSPRLIITAIGMTFMCITVAGLIAVMPRAGGDYVWQTRIMDGIPGAVLGGAFGAVAVFLVGTALALDTALTYGGTALGAIVGAFLGMKRGGLGCVLSATGWWFILALWAPIYGFILKIEFVQPLAALLGWREGVTFFGSHRRHVRRLDRHDRDHLRPRRAGHGRLRADPEMELLHRPAARWRSCSS